MKRAPKVDKNIKSLEESNYKKLIFEMYDILEEGKYNDIKNDPSVAPKKKVNYAIAEVYTKLYEIENIISKNVKLKTEINMDNRMYWKSTKEKLSKLSERLNRVSNYLKNLSA
jgi:HD superfamily phosphohydrolase